MSNHGPAAACGNGRRARPIILALSVFSLLIALSVAPSAAFAGVPDTTITSGPSGPTSNAQPTFTFTAAPSTGSTFECSVDTAAFAACTSPKTITPRLSEGPHKFAVRARNIIGVDKSPATRSFTVDTIAPVVTITSPQNGTQFAKGSNVSVSFATEAGAATKCSLDAATPVGCTSPVTYTAPALGTHTVTVTATDAAANSGSATVSFSVVRSVSPPVVTISSPSGYVFARQFEALFSATSVGGTITGYRCKLVDGTTRATIYDASCSSGQTFSGVVDPHKYTFTVTATDSGGNLGSATSSFTASFPLPAPQLLSGPGNAKTTDPTPVFILGQLDAANYPTQAFECSFVAARAKPAYVPCGSGPLASWTVPSSPRPLGVYDVAFRSRTPDGTISLPAKYTTTITTWGATYSITPSTTQAGAHPDLDIRIVPSAGQLRRNDLLMPKGMIGGLTAFPKCAVSAADQGQCTAPSQIGTSDALLTVFGTNNYPMTGQVYLTEPRVPGDAAGFSIHYPSPQVGALADVIIPMRVILSDNSQQMRIFSDVIPTTVHNIPANIDSQYWVTDFQMHINGSGGSPFPLMTNPSSCAAQQFTWTLGDKVGNTNSGSIPFQATGCASLAFSPQVSETVPNTNAGQTTPVQNSIATASGESSIKSVTVYQPPAIGPNFPAFGSASDQCPASSAPSATGSFDPSGCPVQAKVGTMSITSPLLPVAVSGSVYLINRSPVPWLGIEIVNQSLGIKIGLVGSNTIEDPLPGCDPAVDMCASRLKTSFAAVPDLPATSIQLNLSGPSRTSSTGATLSGDMLVVATADDPSCITSSKIKSVVAAHSGAIVTAYQPITIGGCL